MFVGAISPIVLCMYNSDFKSLSFYNYVFVLPTRLAANQQSVYFRLVCANRNPIKCFKRSLLGHLRSSSTHAAKKLDVFIKKV